MRKEEKRFSSKVGWGGFTFHKSLHPILKRGGKHLKVKDSTTTTAFHIPSCLLPSPDEREIYIPAEFLLRASWNQSTEERIRLGWGGEGGKRLGKIGGEGDEGNVVSGEEEIIVRHRRQNAAKRHRKGGGGGYGSS